MVDKQIEAERSHVLIGLVEELGGLAHQDMATAELDEVVDNMLSKGVPNEPSVELQRWIHTHRNTPGFKLAQILGAHVNKASSIIPECFGKFHDPTAVECKACLDRTLCSIKCKAKNQDTAAPDTAYVVGVANVQTILKVLQGKGGQIAKTLSHGDKVILEVNANKLKVLSVNSPNQETSGQALKKEQDTMAATKGAVKPKPAAVAPVEEEEVDLSLIGDEVEEVEEVEEVAEVAAPAAAAVTKAKKTPKPKPVLNKAQQDFQTALDSKTGEDKQKYSAAVAAKLKITIEAKNDARIDHMLRCMAIKKKLAGVKAAVPAAK